jgi:mono/diheme cytochrome c family protein
MKQNKIYKSISFMIFLFVVTALYAFRFNSPNNNKEDEIFQGGGNDWVAPSFAAKLKNPFAGNTAATKEGKSLFTANCSSCHGDKGEGNGPAAATINPHPKNLTSKLVQEQTDGAIFWKITTGKPPMVSWRSALSEKQRWELVNYIRQLKK